MELVRYEDSGHSWLAVPRQLLIDWKIENQISGFSYQNGSNVLLEEDCDAPLFIEHAAKHSQLFTTIESYTDGESNVRHHQAFKPSEPQQSLESEAEKSDQEFLDSHFVICGI